MADKSIKKKAEDEAADKGGRVTVRVDLKAAGSTEENTDRPKKSDAVAIAIAVRQQPQQSQKEEMRETRVVLSNEAQTFVADSQAPVSVSTPGNGEIALDESRHDAAGPLSPSAASKILQSKEMFRGATAPRASLKKARASPPPVPASASSNATATKRPLSKYDLLLQEADTTDFSDIVSKNVLVRSGVDKDGRAVLVFVPASLPKVFFTGPSAKQNIHRMMLFTLKTMAPIVQRPYTFVYCHTNVKWFNRRLFGFFVRVYRIMPRPFKKNLKRVYILHGTTTIKAFLLVLKQFISKKFWRKLSHIAHSDELDKMMAPAKPQLPAFVRAYDREQQRLQQDKDASRAARRRAMSETVSKWNPFKRNRGQSAASHSTNTGGGSGNQTADHQRPQSAPVPATGIFFGMNLSAQRKLTGDDVPPMLEALSLFVVTHGLRVEGLFRASCSYKRQEAAAQQMNNGVFPQDLLLSKAPDPSGPSASTVTVATKTEVGAGEEGAELRWRVLLAADLYKRFFRSLQDPLLPFSLYRLVASVSQYNESASEALYDELVKGFGKLITALPPAHGLCLRHLLGLVDILAANETSTKMTVHSLAVVFTPSLLRPPLDASPVELLDSVKSSVVVVAFLFEHRHKLVPLSVEGGSSSGQTQAVKAQAASGGGSSLSSDLDPASETVVGILSNDNEDADGEPFCLDEIEI